MAETRNDTIAAIATARGRGGIAVIRISGPDAFSIAGKVVGRDPRDTPRSARGSDPTVRFARTPIDDLLVLTFPHPHSYTGEDVVELQSHGGTIVPEQLLEACFKAGARLANKGEFTLRAFLNGKMDLSAAESVIDLVDAKTDRAAADARNRLNGSLYKEYRSLYENALAISAELEHSLDVDDSDLPPDFFSQLESRVQALRECINALLKRGKEGRILREGALVVLAGPPNAGKSSLLNALLGTNRAIVSDVPGTTRDSIEEYLNIDGWPIRLADTAGLRDTTDSIEEEGVSRAKDLIAKADLVLDLTGEIHAKCDLDRVEGKLNVSAKTGEGLEELKRYIVSHLVGVDFSPRRDPKSPTPSDREIQLLQGTRTLLSAELADPVLAANALRAAAETLGSLTGAIYPRTSLTTCSPASV